MSVPKIVDHAARRAEIAAAVWRLVGRAGVEGATVRAVAAESGWSMGSVRHYFKTQEELLRFACEEMEQRVVARVRGHYAGPDGVGAPDGGPNPDRAVRMLEELLPLDDDRRVEVLVWLAFMTRARVDTALDDIRAASWIGERYLARLAVADALGRPLPRDLAEHLDPALEPLAERVHLTVDALSLQGVTHPEHWPVDELQAAVERLVGEITTQAGQTGPPTGDTPPKDRPRVR